MRYRLLALPLFALITIGCGGGDNKAAPVAPPAPSAPAVTYDLAKYLIPTKTQTNKYITTNYENENGERYRQVKLTNYIEDFTLIDANKTQMSEDGKNKYNYMLDGKNLVQKDFTTSNIIETVERNVTVGKIVSDLNGTKCTISEHIDSSTVNNNKYTDILKKSCKKVSTSTATAGSFTIKTETTITKDTLYAKDNGLISMTKISCDDGVSDINNSQHNIKCKKEETILTDIIAN